MSPIQQMLLGVGAVATKTYVNDVFSTYVYDGTGSSHAINNGIDLSGEGGLLWVKSRSHTYDNLLFDTERGTNKILYSNTSAQASNDGSLLSSFNSTGFTTGSTGEINSSSETFASWSFRKAPGFFDIVTYTGNNTARTISHSLGSVPGFIMVKATNRTSGWVCWHRELGNTKGLALNSTAAESTPPWNATYWNSTGPTATHFSIGTNADVNHGDSGSEGTYVAYLFAGGESTAATARSVEYDGLYDSLTLAATSDFDFGSSDWTIEGWWKSSAVSASVEALFGLGTYTAAGGILFYQYQNSLKFQHAGTDEITISPNPLDQNVKQWHHIAVVRSGSKVTIYINGVSAGSYTPSGTFGDGTNNTFYVGDSSGSHWWKGSISNFRVVKGTAVYTSSFRPPTEPLTNITNTKLLCCNNSSTTGSTVTPGTITAGGDPTASTDSPFDDPAGFVFGENEDQGIIKTGSYVGNGSSDGPEINLGWEPQWLLVKRTDSSKFWIMFDNMRGWAVGQNNKYLIADSSGAEGEHVNFVELTSTGFKCKHSDSATNANEGNYIYMALRRSDGYVGKPPELGTGVFAMDTGNSSSTIPCFDSTFPVDFGLMREPATSSSWLTGARLTGDKRLFTNTTGTESSDSNVVFDSNVGYFKDLNSDRQAWMWKRHAGFDVVAYEGNGTSGSAFAHSLGKVPEMMWVKRRSGSAEGWAVYHKGLNGGSSPEDWNLKLDENAAQEDTESRWNDTAPTSTHFFLGDSSRVNTNDEDYIAMLFASVENISSVGSYVGSASSQTITTGFQPRFVIIKAYNQSQAWIVLDTTRGWGSGNDEYLNLAYNGAQTNHAIGAPTSTGFTLPAEDNTGLDEAWNHAGYSYIYYAHA